MKTLINILIIALLAFANLNAKIIYTDINPDSILVTNGAIPTDVVLDFDMDDNREFFIRHHETIQFFSGYNGSLVLCHPNFYGYMEPTVLNLGDSIMWNQPEWYNSNHSSINLTERWDGQTNKYIGLKFKLGNNWHYGWLEISIPLDHHNCVVHGYAYNSNPNEGIKAGEISSNFIESEFISSDILLYPNPANDYLNIDNPSLTKMEIYSNYGEKVIQCENIYSIDIKNLSNGIYFLKINNKTYKFIKK